MRIKDYEFNLYNYFASEGEKGMTSTAANKLANLAKEKNREDYLYIENVQFYSETMKLLVNPGEDVTLNQGTPGTPEEFEKIHGALKRIARYNAFISWVREAIDAKSKLVRNIQSMSLEQWCKKNGRECPKAPEDDIDDKMSQQMSASESTIDEMAQYYIYEAKASLIGQAIHPGGFMDKARRELIDAGLKPSWKEGLGKDTVVITRTPTAKSDSVNDFYMSLQGEWRKAESRVNEHKTRWATKDTEQRIKLTNEYQKELRAYENELSRLKDEWEKWGLEETRRVYRLKIHIPAALQPIMDELLALYDA